MHWSNIVLLVTPVLAFTIPENQPNGVYSVSYAEDGTETHTLINAIDETTPSLPLSLSPGANSAKFAKRDDGISCGGDELNHGDTDRANAELDAQCGNGRAVGRNLDVYSIVGCTVSYFCNFAGDTTCRAIERQADSAGITRTCGWYQSGWSTYRGWSSYGYEAYCKAPGWNFCGRGTGGKM